VGAGRDSSKDARSGASWIGGWDPAVQAGEDTGEDEGRGYGELRVCLSRGLHGDGREVSRARCPEPRSSPLARPAPATLIIAIDGPAAAGKGTLARRIAATLGLPYLDTGLLYRAVGRRLLDAGSNPADPIAAAAAARALRPVDLERDDLRGPVADAAAASVAAIPAVRAALLDFQRDFATGCGAVLDGRDIGTVIFPDASVKLYVIASLAERARRRWQELRAKGITADLATVEAEMLARDTRDAPNMRRAADAIELDTTSLDAERAFQRALHEIRAKLKRADHPM
jgi:cytidylate kinase